MTTSEFVLLLAAILLVVGFAGLMVAVVRVNDSLRTLRSEMQTWRHEVMPLVDSLRETTNDARHVMDEARQDLGRFDRVLGSAEAISGAVEGSARATRVAFSTPVIKVAAFASGTTRAARRLRRQSDPKEARKRR